MLFPTPKLVEGKSILTKSEVSGTKHLSKFAAALLVRNWLSLPFPMIFSFKCALKFWRINPAFKSPDRACFSIAKSRKTKAKWNSQVKLPFCFDESFIEHWWTLILRLDSHALERETQKQPKTYIRICKRLNDETSWRGNMIDWFLIKFFFGLLDKHNALSNFYHYPHCSSPSHRVCQSLSDVFRIKSDIIGTAENNFSGLRIVGAAEAIACRFPLRCKFPTCLSFEISFCSLQSFSHDWSGCNR